MTAEQEMRSAVLMRSAQAGDQTAYASLLVLLTSATRQFARARLGTVPWIDDVVQETLLAVHRARHTYDPGRPFAPWFYAVASSRMIDVIRRERRVSSRQVSSESVRDVAGDLGMSESAVKVTAHRGYRTLKRLLGGARRED